MKPLYRVVQIGDDGQFLGYYTGAPWLGAVGGRYYIFRRCAERRARILNENHRHSTFYVEATR